MNDTDHKTSWKYKCHERLPVTLVFILDGTNARWGEGIILQINPRSSIQVESGQVSRTMRYFLEAELLYKSFCLYVCLYGCMYVCMAVTLFSKP